MELLSVALDVLQCDRYATLGFFLPTLCHPKCKLDAVHQTIAKQLQFALINGTQKKFG
jgi:hypothetical protein